MEEEKSTIPIIDVSLLTSTDPNQRSKAVQDITNACLNWGLFMAVNHGIEEKQMNEIVEICGEFFKVSEDEKKEYVGKGPFDPISCGTHVHGDTVGISLWRSFVKLHVHPKFHCPNKPLGFSKAVEEYCAGIRKVGKELLGGISESLGVESGYIEKTLNLESGFDLFACNLYPPCPEPDLAMGLPPHTDYTLLNMLIANGVDGLQFQRKGHWVDVNPPPGAIIVNLGDQLQILSNGKYNSHLHKAVVNNESTRISIILGIGPSLDAVVAPILELPESSANYTSIAYKDYLQVLFGRKFTEKYCIDHLKIV